MTKFRQRRSIDIGIKSHVIHTTSLLQWRQYIDSPPFLLGTSVQYAAVVRWGRGGHAGGSKGGDSQGGVSRGWRAVRFEEGGDGGEDSMRCPWRLFFVGRIRWGERCRLDDFEGGGSDGETGVCAGGLIAVVVLGGGIRVVVVVGGNDASDGG